MITSTIVAAVLFAQSEGSASTLSFLFPIVIMGGLFYVLLILPQRRRRKKMDEMRADIGIGAEIRTIGGIVGTVVGEDDETFTIDVGGSTMKIIKRAIAERTDTGEA
ncbi:MAG: preprotein translocase subunit YajC [Actinomycetota bacterium]